VHVRSHFMHIRTLYILYTDTNLNINLLTTAQTCFIVQQKHHNSQIQFALQHNFRKMIQTHDICTYCYTDVTFCAVHCNAPEYEQRSIAQVSLTLTRNRCCIKYRYYWCPVLCNVPNIVIIIITIVSSR
jgi:hypothetical protein